ncbi:oligosaccharide flippase family protein [Flavobacterium sp. Fl-318]|uniref:Oligosaccharide flippase family protein n=1 Tax=Flavobacterium cupriresistens TaxID=2893885 RepID=A0ABU4RD05_9FLAO|nr:MULTISPECIES: oligosaccharide flippase family protein [unclassified Flavobacterium]MDX6190461.1 oligosaccharide flippase family protein [Flavobacterium sp. Fl-318]UFH43524.1 oligosaccharide flippase family protein [Flavobacterium sp. F-323]
MQHNRIKNFIIYGIGQVFNLVSPLLVMPYLVAICEKEGLGKIGVGFSFALILNVLVDYGSYINGTKEISINRSNPEIIKRKIVSIYIMKLFLIVVLLLLAFLLICFVPFFNKEQAVFFFSFSYVIGQFINPTWVFQGLENYKWITFVNITSKIIYVAGVFIFINKKGDYIYANAFLGLGLIIASLIGLISLIKKYDLRLYKNVSKDALELLKKDFSLTFSQLFLSFYQYLPIMIISYVGGNNMAGQYRIIDQIIMTFRTYLQMFFNFIYADVCLQVHKNLKNGISQWFKYNGLNYVLVLSLLIIAVVSTKQILLYFNIRSNELESMTLFFKTGLIIPIFMAISMALKQLLFALDRNKEYINITIGSSFFSLFVFFILVKNIGLQGAFIATISIEILIIVLYGIVLKPIIRLSK